MHSGGSRAEMLRTWLRVFASEEVTKGQGFVPRMNCWSDFLDVFETILFFGSRWQGVQVALGGCSLGTTDRCFGRIGSHTCGSKLFSRCF